ncbi:MAG: cytochrome c-type biogenesis protein CcmH [Gammaproteobacteria bacterium]|nr:cytochrome c-type biogenesis protein CcmH [Gammaproteobacteria bacterium]
MTGRTVLGIAALCIAATLSPASSVVDAYDFDNPALEARYRTLIAELRCPKCLNVNIAGSDAPIASDLRRAVRRMLEEGRTDQEILAHLQDRYGDFILYNPPLSPATVLLWATPAVLILVGLLVLRRLGSRRDAVELTEEERARLDALGAEDP